jgi:hypothetical protein
VHHADESDACEFDWLVHAVTLGCGGNSPSRETPASVATAHVEIDDVEEVSTRSMLPEKLFRLFGVAQWSRQIICCQISRHKGEGFSDKSLRVYSCLVKLYKTRGRFCSFVQGKK